jgi:hypothetical protein
MPGFHKPLKMTTKQTFYVNSYDLDDFVSMIYGIQYEMVPDCEMSNDSAKTLNVSATPPNSWSQEVFDKAQRQGYFPTHSIHAIMADCCARGFIPAGEYVIKVSW